MITQDYISNLLQKAGINASIQFVSGYDAAMALVENARESFPMVIVEDNTSGVFSAEYGGVDSFNQSVWVMCAVIDRDGITKNKASEQAMLITRKILAYMISDKDSGNCDAVALDLSSMPYFTRNTTVASGWELQLTFNESVNLSIYD